MGKTSGTKKKHLKKQISTLRGELTKTEKKLAKAKKANKGLKKEAAAQRQAAARSGTRADKLRTKLERAKEQLEPTTAATPEEAAAADLPAGTPTTEEGVTKPDGSWTVAQLRAEARSRGMSGMSSKNKAQLLGALT